MSEKDFSQTQKSNEWAEKRRSEIKQEYRYYFINIDQHDLDQLFKNKYIKTFDGLSPEEKHIYYTLGEWSEDKEKSPRITIVKMEYLKRLHAMPLESAALISRDLVDQIVKEFLPINDVQVIVEYLFYDFLWHGLDQICLTEYDGEELKYLKQLTGEVRLAKSIGEKTKIAEKVIKVIGREHMIEPIAENIKRELRDFADVQTTGIMERLYHEDMEKLERQKPTPKTQSRIPSEKESWWKRLFD